MRRFDSRRDPSRGLEHVSNTLLAHIRQRLVVSRRYHQGVTGVGWGRIEESERPVVRVYAVSRRLPLYNIAEDTR